METPVPLQRGSSKGQDTAIVVLSALAILGTISLIFRKQIYAGFQSLANAVGVAAKSVLTAEQEYYISDLNITPGVQDKFRNFIAELRKRGWRTIITSGNRNFAEQAQLKIQNSSNAAPGLSAHNYGLAFDGNFENVATGQVLKKASTKKEWLDSGIPQLAKSMGLKWGGYDNEAEYLSAFTGIGLKNKKENKSLFSGYFDPVHFEIPVNTTALLAQAKQKYGNDVTKIIGNEMLIA